MSKIKISSVVCAFFAIHLNQASAVIVATDTFDGTSAQNGGTGWAADWTTTNQYQSGGSKIDGANSYGGYASGGTSRLISSTTSTAGEVVTINWSYRSDFDVATDDGNAGLFRQVGANVLNSSGTTLLTLKFTEGNASLLINDGGGDFGAPAPGVSFATGAIYRFSFTSVVGSNQYSFTASGNGGSSSGTDFTYTGRTTDSVGGLGFFWSGPGGAGNDVFLDTVSVDVVPEVSSALLAGLGAVGLMHRRRRCHC